MIKGNKILAVLFIFVMVAVSFGIAIAEEGYTTDGNDRKGKYLFRKNCRTCHVGDPAPDLSPNSKTQGQWDEAFNKKLKRGKISCAEEWKKLSQTDLNDIYTYLYNHAYDSPQPATCK